MKDNARDTGDAAQAAPFLLSADHRRRNGGAGYDTGNRPREIRKIIRGRHSGTAEKNLSRGKKKLQ